jgi:hypothetical protein
VHVGLGPYWAIGLLVSRQQGYVCALLFVSDGDWYLRVFGSQDLGTEAELPSIKPKLN